MVPECEQNSDKINTTYCNKVLNKNYFADEHVETEEGGWEV
jgi:hypothetical protein